MTPEEKQRELKRFKELALNTALQLVRGLIIKGDDKEPNILTESERIYQWLIKDLVPYVELGEDVPLENKVYDFIPVMVRDHEDDEWEERELIAVVADKLNPYITSLGDTGSSIAGMWKYAKFILKK